MKKIIYIAAWAIGGFSQISHADFFDVYAGASAWQPSLSGGIQSQGGVVDVDAQLDINEDTGGIVHFAFEHPIPFLPNVRGQYTSLSVDGFNGALTAQFDFAGIPFELNDQVSTFADLSHFDGTIYWELWDFIAEVDVGITGRVFNGEIDIISELAQSTAEVRFEPIIPMFYGKAGVKIPFTGLSAAVTLNALDFEDIALYDVTARVNYEVVLGLGVEAGYRIFELEADDGDVFADLSVDGFFAGISYQF